MAKQAPMAAQVGSEIEFTGYTNPEDDNGLLEVGAKYTVIAVDDTERSVDIKIPNPDFNPKRAASEKNPEFVEVNIFEEEFAVVPSKPARAARAAAKQPVQEEAGEDEDYDAPAQEEHTPAKTASKAPARTASKAPAKATAGKSAAKVAAKGKTPAKGKAQAKAEDEDVYGDLTEEQEDPEIVALVDSAEDILELAVEVCEESAATDYKLGGVLFHVRKSGAYKEIDKRYAEKGGFGLYVLEQLNTEYRKAMYLIDIYYKTSKYGLDASRISAIGWAKAAKIAAVMTEDTAEELLELAETNTVVDLVENIKTSYKEEGGTKGTKQLVKIFKFKLLQDSANAIEEILTAVAAAMSFKSVDQAFEHIVSEWALEHPVGGQSGKTVARAAAKATAAKATAPRAAGRAAARG